MIPLRLHSDFSLLRAMVPIEKYCQALSDRGYRGAAITDFDNGFGWVDYYFQMKKAGLKPALGTTLNLGLISQAKAKGLITLIALTEKGYQNLCLILSAYSFETLNLELLLEWSQD